MNVFDELIRSFENLDALGWAGQICGLFAFVIIEVAYLCSKRKFAIISSFAFFLFILESGFSKLYSNMIIDILCLIRNLLTYFFLAKYNRQIPRKIVFIILIVMFASTFTYIGVSNTWAKWDNYLPLIIVSIVTFTQNRKNEFVVKGGQLFNESGYLAYYCYNGLPLSILRQVVLVIAIIAGFGLLFFKDYKAKKKALKETE